MSSSSDPAMREILLKEYDTLRAETLKRLEFRYQLYGLTVLLAGTLLTVGASLKGVPQDSLLRALPTVLLVYPIVSLFFAAAFAFNSLMIRTMGRHIRVILEKELGFLSWAKELENPYVDIVALEDLATNGLFVATPILSLLLAAFIFGFGPNPYLTSLAVADVGAVFLTWLVLNHPDSVINGWSHVRRWPGIIFSH